MSKIIDTECAIHVSIVEYLRLVLPGALIWHTPNGGKRGAREAAELKRMGVKAGVPDIAIVIDGRLYFLEVKTPKGVLSEPQEQFCVALDCHGIPWAVVRSVEDARAFLAAHSVETREAA